MNNKTKGTKKIDSNTFYFLRGLIGDDLKLSDIKKSKKYYSNNYEQIAKIYGFKDFITMYKYCMSDKNAKDFAIKSDNTENHVIATPTGGKSKEKDTSDLVLATKTGTRNGKPYTSRYWTDPDKVPGDKHAKESSVEDTNISAYENGLYLGGDKFGKPLPTTKDNSEPPASWSTVGKYRKNCFDYIYAINNDEISFMSGLVKTDDIISIAYASAPTDKDLLGYVHTLLSKVIKEAWLANYGVQFVPDMFKKYLVIDTFCTTFSLKRVRNTYKATPSQLQNILGDSTCLRVLQ